jgi:molybdopterin synthase sulfur carrier subunit
MKVLFYGRLAEAIGSELEIGAPPGCSVAEVRDRLIAQHPDIEEVLSNRRAKACVADRLVPDDYLVGAGETVEFLPPVSGG